MHTVIETPIYLGSLGMAGVSADERQGIIDLLAADPTAGDLIRETGGARKVRYARLGGGKSGGYRVITFFGGADIPVFLLDIYGKGQKASLSAADKRALAKVLPKIPAAYRAGSSMAAERMTKARSEPR